MPDTFLVAWQVMTAPMPMSANQMSELAKIRLFVDAKQPRPDWLASVCWNRAVFCGTVFVVVQGEQRMYYKFLYATQTPQNIVFAPLTLVEPYVDTDQNWEDAAVERWRWQFDCDVLKFVHGFELSDVPVERLFMLAGVEYLTGGGLGTDFDEEPLTDVLADLPKGPAASTSSETRSTQPAVSPTLLNQFPWLTGGLEQDQAKAKTAKVAGGTGDGHSGSSCALFREELTDEQYEDIFVELQEARARVAAESGKGDGSDFRMRVLGGKWTAEHRGRAFDAYAGEASAGEPSKWAVQYSMGRSARFDVSLYTAKGASCLAKTWRCKCQYFYDIWLVSGGGRYAYTADDIAGWPEPEEFTELASSYTGRALQRCLWLRDLSPRLGV